jgi:hypothetical protein
MSGVLSARPHRRPDPVEVSLSISPSASVQLLNVSAAARTREISAEYPRVFYSSLHTTAGYLEQRTARSLCANGQGIAVYMQQYLKQYPPDAGYHHDVMHLRPELSREQRCTEPRNAHSHLVYIASGLSACVKYTNQPKEPVYLVELDGVNGEERRKRTLRLVGYSREEAVAQAHWTVPLAPNTCVDLGVSSCRLFEQLALMVRSHRVTKGRVLLALAAGMPNAALTVNEYEPLLILRDLCAVLDTRAANDGHEYAMAGGIPPGMPFHRVDDSGAAVQESPFRTGGNGHSGNGQRVRHTKRARCGLSLRRSVSLLVSDYDTPGVGKIVRGQYQSPILMPLGAPIAKSVALTATLLRFV